MKRGGATGEGHVALETGAVQLSGWSYLWPVGGAMAAWNQVMQDQSLTTWLMWVAPSWTLQGPQRAMCQDVLVTRRETPHMRYKHTV